MPRPSNTVNTDNLIAFAEKMVPVFDQVYQREALSANLDAGAKVNFTGVNKVEIMRVDTDGLGNYERNKGYAGGAVSINWDPYVLEIERSKSFDIDRFDNEETFGVVIGATVADFMRMHVVPEIDSFRFAKYATMAGSSVSATLNSTTIVEALDEAVRKMDEDHVPRAGRVVYMNSNLQPIMNKALDRSWSSDSAVNTILSNYNGLPIHWVVPDRFNSSIEMFDGTAGQFGYAPDGPSINFLMLDPTCIFQVVKHANPKIFSADENQTKDSWLFQYRLYHDAFVYVRRTQGLYANIAV